MHSVIDLIIRLADEHLALMISDLWADHPRRAAIASKLQELRRTCPQSYRAAEQRLARAPLCPRQGGQDVP